jgi:opacity protein-like surface antigen
MTVNPYDHFGFEVGYIYNRTNLNIAGQDQGGMAVHQGYGNALAYLNKSEARIRPFATGGLNFSNFVPPGSSAQYGGGQNKFGFNYGGGIKVKITGMWQARFDIRQFNTGKPGFGVLTGLSGRLLMTEYSAGIGVGF